MSGVVALPAVGEDVSAEDVDDCSWNVRGW